MVITHCTCKTICKRIRFPQSEERFINLDAQPSKYKDKNKDKRAKLQIAKLINYITEKQTNKHMTG